MKLKQKNKSRKGLKKLINRMMTKLDKKIKINKMCGMKSKIKETLKSIKNKVNSNRKNKYQIKVNNNQRI